MYHDTNADDSAYLVFDGHASDIAKRCERPERGQQPGNETLEKEADMPRADGAGHHIREGDAAETPQSGRCLLPS